MTIKNRSHDPYELDHALDKQNNPIECLMHSGWHDVRSDCTSCDEQPRVVDTFERDGGTTRGKPTAQEKNKHYAQCYQKTKEKEDNAWYAFEPQCFCKERKVLRVGHKMPVIPEAFPDVDNWHKDDCPETAYERARRCGNTRMLKVFDDHEYKNLEALRQKVARGERLKKELAQARQKKRELATQKMYEWQTVRSRRSRKNTNIHNTDTHELQI